jgi:uncharacterized protein YjbI with pentapeptide repeats
LGKDVLLAPGNYQLADKDWERPEPLTLQSCFLAGVDLHEAKLQGVDISEAQLQGIYFLKANLQKANISKSRCKVRTSLE